MAGVALAVNVVMDAARRPVAILAGLPPLVMREAARLTRELYGFRVGEPYDVVIASAGGTPKDICLYQAQKALNAAMQCARPGARILLAAECAQGIGDTAYFAYVSRFSSAGELMADFENGEFRMGAHKAYLFARTAARYDLVVHSSLQPELLEQCLLTPGNMQAAVDRWLGETPGARVAVLTNANSSYFYAKQEG